MTQSVKIERPVVGKNMYIALLLVQYPARKLSECSKDSQRSHPKIDLKTSFLGGDFPPPNLLLVVTQQDIQNKIIAIPLTEEK